MINYAVQVTIQGDSSQEDLSSGDKKVLHSRPSFNGDRPIVPLDTLASHEKPAQPLGTTPTVREILEGYREVDRRSQEALDLLERRSQGLIMPIDPATQPDLFKTVNNLFESKEPIVEVTYSMYRKIVEYAKDLGLLLGAEA